MRYISSERGSAAAEFAIWLTVLVPTILNVIDFGTYAYAKMQVAGVAQSAAQAVWRNCTDPAAAATCSNSYVLTAINFGSPLGSKITESTGSGARAFGYYCSDLSGANLVKAADQTKATTCTDTGATSGYYMRLQVQFTYTPLFSAVSLASLLTTPIQETAWTRLA